MAPSAYTLNNGRKGVEERRLDSQHTVFKTMTDGALLPRHISEHLSALETPAIADVATGTGIWLRHLALELPTSAELHGYDFDISKFPNSDELPANLTLQFADALEQFPDAVLYKYDLVHVRLMMYALKADDWEVVAANLRKLLKPGGWLMWEELSYTSWTCLPMSRSFSEWISREVRFAAAVGRDIRQASRGIV